MTDDEDDLPTCMCGHEYDDHVDIRWPACDVASCPCDVYRAHA